MATGDPGKLYMLEDRYTASGTITSEVLDAKLVSKWGALRWQARTPDRTSLSVAVRSGNVSEPDETWSDWSDEQTDGDEAQDHLAVGAVSAIPHHAADAGCRSHARRWIR